MQVNLSTTKSSSMFLTSLTTKESESAPSSSYVTIVTSNFPSLLPPSITDMAISLFASFRTYVLSSVLLTTAVLSHAILTKRFFYRSVVHLANSKFAILAVANMALVTVLLIWRFIQALFLGPLRFRETERLHIRARDAIIECCFAISVFREEFDEKFVALVMTLLLLKSLHWLTKDRIEFLEEQPLAPRRTHIRLVGLMLLLATLDTFLVTKCVGVTISTNERTMFALFAFEFTLLQIELLADTFKYVFLLIDTRMDNRWDSKSLYTFYSELICDMCQLTIYIVFFIYVQIHYSFPYHIIRELYMTFHKFRRRCADFLRYRHVVATMNDLFADATEEELAEGDRTCIICREEMTAAKKLSCGHMFHARCLQSWLKRQLTCPTCRATIDVTGNTQQQAHQNPQQQNVQRELQPGRQPNAENQPQNLNGQQPQQRRPQQQGQQPVNLGDAGQRLLNFANDWWNQVMHDAGMQGQNPRLPHMMYGPNAIAHRQLRQRRRGAWPGPYQPYAPPGAANQNPFARNGQQPQQQQPQQQQLQQQPPQQRQQQAQQPQDPEEANRRAPQHVSGGGGSSANNVATSTNQSSTQASSSRAPPSETPQSEIPQSETPGQPSSATGPLSTQPSSSTQRPSTDTTGQPPSETVTRLPPLQTLFPEDHPEAERVFPVYQYIGRGYRGTQASRQQSSGVLPSVAQTSNANNPNQQQQSSTVQAPNEQTPNPQSFPLARLLAIQEQIEILRSEVQELVLLATNPPQSDTELQEPSESNVGTATDGHGATENSSTESSRNQTAGGSESNATPQERELAAAGGAPGEAQGANNNSEAERVRRRRIEFLERRSAAS